MHAPPFSAAIVGCGRIAGIKDIPGREGGVQTHAQAYYRHREFVLVAACDSDATRLATFVDRWHVPRGFGAVDEMVSASRPDVVSLCSPTTEHYRQLTMLLRHPEPPLLVFVEKPVCERVEELEVLERLARESGVAVLVNHTRRFDPSHRRLAQLIGSGTLGELVRGRCDYYGGWLHNGPHVVDTLRMLFGLEPSLVTVVPGAPGKPGDPCWDVRLQLGAARLEVEGFDEGHYQLFETDLRFERGRVQMRNFGADIVAEEMAVNALGERVLVPVAGSPWVGLDSPLYHAVSAIAGYLGGGAALADTGATLAQARGTMDLIWRAIALGGGTSDLHR